MRYQNWLIPALSMLLAACATQEPASSALGPQAERQHKDEHLREVAWHPARSGLDQQQLTVGLSQGEQRVAFPFDLAPGRLSAEAVLEQSWIEPLAAYLKTHERARIVIEGHTDTVGDSAYNQRVSTLRAQVVRDALLARGVDAGQVSAVGKGEGAPRHSNFSAQGRALNNRIEVVVVEDSLLLVNNR